MIQRIQTAYLLLTTVLSVLFPAGCFLKFINKEGLEIYLKLNGIYRSAGGNIPEFTGRALPVTILSLLIPLTAFIVIFLFKNRQLQMKITIILMFLEFLFAVSLAYYSFLIIHNYGAYPAAGIFFAIPAIIIILLYLAYRATKKDDDLVRSYDRLR
jgi:hypothetical protein